MSVFTKGIKLPTVDNTVVAPTITKLLGLKCPMSTNTRRQRTYDHRLKELVRSTGNIDVAIQRGVPRSTARGWLTKNMSDVITVDVLETSLVELQREVVSLRRRNARLIALLRLIITVMKVTRFTLSQIRLPQEGDRTVGRTQFTISTGDFIL